MIQDTAEVTCVAILTVPDTVAPLAGLVILTADAGVGVADGVLVGVGLGVALGVAVGVGVGPPLATVTVIESLPIWAPLLENARVEIVCGPLVTVVEFQLKVKGGDELK